MPVNAQWVFDCAIRILDGQSDSGMTDTADTSDYKLRTIPILNALVPLLYPFSDTYSAAAAGVRPVPELITSLEDDVPLDDVLARSVLPLGLACTLALNDDAALASNLKMLYDEALARLAGRIPAASEAITDCYGVVSETDGE